MTFRRISNESKNISESQNIDCKIISFMHKCLKGNFAEFMQEIHLKNPKNIT